MKNWSTVVAAALVWGACPVACATYTEDLLEPLAGQAGRAAGGAAGFSGAAAPPQVDDTEAGSGGVTTSMAAGNHPGNTGGVNAAPAGGAGAGSGGELGPGAGGNGNDGGTSGASGGGGVEPVLLSQGKPVTADSEESDRANVATNGNDGDPNTRWCADDGEDGHYWQVDLGASYALNSVAIQWQSAEIYQFVVEGSTNEDDWHMLLDQSSAEIPGGYQYYTLAGSPRARWVRITVTRLPTSAWASFYELKVYGH